MIKLSRSPSPPLSVEEAVALIEVKIWAFVVVAVTLILMFIVGALLYSVTFVTQPIKSMAPIDQAYTKMLNDIVLLIVGGIGGVIGKRAVSAAAKSMAPTPTPGPSYAGAPCAHPTQSVAMHYAPQAAAMPNFNWMGHVNPQLDESWTPGPPPTTPPEHLESEEERERLAAARKEAEA